MQNKVQEQAEKLIQKYGIKPKQRYGDVIVGFDFKENLKRMAEKHYKRTKLKDTHGAV